MPSILLMGDEGMAGIIKERLEAIEGNLVQQACGYAYAEGFVEEISPNYVIVQSSRCAEYLRVVAACYRHDVPCAIYHENVSGDWDVQMAIKYFNATVVVRPFSHNDDPDYNQEDQNFAQMIVEAALDAYHKKIAVPTG